MILEIMLACVEIAREENKQVEQFILSEDVKKLAIKELKDSIFELEFEDSTHLAFAGIPITVYGYSEYPILTVEFKPKEML